MKKAGKILLLISGIAIIALSIWSLIAAIIGLFGIIGGAASGDADAKAALLIAGIVLVITCGLSFLFSLLAGLAGIKTFAKGDQKNINRAFVWAIIILVLGVIGIIFSFSAVGIISLVVDVLYIVGAFMVKLSK